MFALSASPAQARLAYGVVGGSLLVTINTNAPGTLVSSVGITGKPPTEAILALDVQPSTGRLYGLGSDSHLYTINPQTGAATVVGSGPFSPGISGIGYGFDFNPVTGLIRVVGEGNRNFELNPATAEVATHPNLTPPAGTVVSAAAYSNNYAGATTTTLFDIGQGAPPADVFQQQLSPDDGTLALIGSFGTGLGSITSFDIGPDNAAFAFSGTTLYSVNTATGAATPLGSSGFLLGLALARPLQPSVFSVSFAPEPVGQVSLATPITITNTSDNPIPVAPSVTGSGASQFKIVTDTCGTELASMGSCTIGVVSSPTQPGAATATLSMNGVGTGNNATIPLSGEGVGPAVSFSPTSLAFGTQAVGSSTAARTVTITNTGNSALDVTSVSLNGDVRDFALRSQTCTAAPIAPGASCEASIAFDPVAAGAKTAHLHLVDNARSGAQQVALTGTGAPAHFTLSATRLTFANTLVGAASPNQTLTVHNTGQTPLDVSTLSLSGSGLRSFDIASQTCTGTPVAVGATCTVSVAFAPLTTGAMSATLHVVTNAAGVPGSVALAGTGQARRAGVAFAAQRTFGTRRLGRTRNLTIALRSTGTAPLEVSRVRIGGRNPGQFRIRSQDCTAGTIAPGRRCVIRMAFRPTSPGGKRATLIVTDNVPGKATRIALAGRGRR